MNDVLAVPSQIAISLQISIINYVIPISTL
jgi:hypothetical protein